jgi:Tol biopolymer transport system component
VTSLNEESINGSKITFASNRAGAYEIYVMNSDGTDLVVLTDSSDQDMYPSWSPDCSKIVFGSDRNGSMEIFE